MPFCPHRPASREVLSEIEAGVLINIILSKVINLHICNQLNARDVSLPSAVLPWTPPAFRGADREGAAMGSNRAKWLGAVRRLESAEHRAPSHTHGLSPAAASEAARQGGTSHSLDGPRGSASGRGDAVGRPRAQRFTVGSSASRYVLNSVDLVGRCGRGGALPLGRLPALRWGTAQRDLPAQAALGRPESESCSQPATPRTAPGQFTLRTSSNWFAISWKAARRPSSFSLLMNT